MVQEFSQSQYPDATSSAGLDGTGGLLGAANALAGNSLDQALNTLTQAVNEPWQRVQFQLIPIPISAPLNDYLVNVSGTNVMIAAADSTLPNGWFISIAFDSPSNGPVPRGLGNQVTGAKFSQLYLTLEASNTNTGNIYLVVWSDTPTRRVELR
jgi:hypothetical protein